METQKVASQTTPAGFKTFQEFWPFYLEEHSNPKNRWVHFIGTFLAHLILLIAFFTSNWNLLWLLPVIGYGFAWVGHFFIQQNKPATFQYPLWSLRGDFKMFYLMCLGKLWI